MPPFMKTDCKTKCDDKGDYCSLTIGGPKVYIGLAMVAYIATIVFYFSEHVINFVTWTRTSNRYASLDASTDASKDASTDASIDASTDASIDASTHRKNR